MKKRDQKYKAKRAVSNVEEDSWKGHSAEPSPVKDDELMTELQQDFLSFNEAKDFTVALPVTEDLEVKLAAKFNGSK